MQPGNQILKVETDTVFKKEPRQSANLEPDQTYRVSKGERFEILAITENVQGEGAEHVKITLRVPIKGISTWYAFSLHVSCQEDVDRKPEDDGFITDLSAIGKKSSDRGAMILIPGGSEKVGLNDPILPTTPNIKWYELTHKGTRLPPDVQTVRAFERVAILAQKVRGFLGNETGKTVPLLVTSGYRPLKINQRVGGSSQSRHLRGDAIDFVVGVDGLNNRKIYELLDPWLIGGLGVYGGGNRCSHIDARGYKARWFHAR